MKGMPTPKPLMGLHGREVVMPVAYCALHDVYLTVKDLSVRECIWKECNHLVWLKDKEKRRGLSDVVRERIRAPYEERKEVVG